MQNVVERRKDNCDVYPNPSRLMYFFLNSNLVQSLHYGIDTIRILFLRTRLEHVFSA